MQGRGAGHAGPSGVARDRRAVADRKARHPAGAACMRAVPPPPRRRTLARTPALVVESFSITNGSSFCRVYGGRERTAR
jgi:hypothetical protein